MTHTCVQMSMGLAGKIEYRVFHRRCALAFQYVLLHDSVLCSQVQGQRHL